MSDKKYLKLYLMCAASLTWLFVAHVRRRALYTLTLHYRIAGHIVVEPVQPHRAVVCGKGPESNREDIYIHLK